jgi:hypothetical protein
VILVPVFIIFLGLLVGVTHCAYRVEKIFSRQPVVPKTPTLVPDVVPTTPKVPVVLTKKTDPARAYAVK